jgi:hypothetical protein
MVEVGRERRGTHVHVFLDKLIIAVRVAKTEMREEEGEVWVCKTAGAWKVIREDGEKRGAAPFSQWDMSGRKRSEHQCVSPCFSWS